MSASPAPMGQSVPMRRFGIIGFGFVGRATAHAFAEHVDIAHHDPASHASCSLDELTRSSDALFVCVPTPRSPSGAADVTIVEAVLQELSDRRVDVPVVLKSTVPPGSTARWAKVLAPLPLVFSPEFLREAHHLEDALRPSRVVLGWTENVGQLHREVLTAFHDRQFPRTPLLCTDATTAELLKYTSNALFGVKVSLANELAELAETLGVEWETIRSSLVLDPRVGDAHLRVPGPDGRRGFGGSCLPKDMSALLTVADELGVRLEVVRAALSANVRRRA